MEFVYIIKKKSFWQNVNGNVISINSKKSFLLKNDEMLLYCMHIHNNNFENLKTFTQSFIRITKFKKVVSEQKNVLSMTKFIFDHNNIS